MLIIHFHTNKASVIHIKRPLDFFVNHNLKVQTVAVILKNIIMNKLQSVFILCTVYLLTELCIYIVNCVIILCAVYLYCVLCI